MKLLNTTIIKLDDGENRRIIVRPESVGSRVCVEHHHPDEPIDAHYLSRGDARELAAALLLAVSGVDETEPTLDAAPQANAKSADWPGEGYRLLVDGEAFADGDSMQTVFGPARLGGAAIGETYSQSSGWVVRRKMPGECPFEPGQVLKTITDVEDAKYWQNRGVRFEAICDDGEWSDPDPSIPWYFTDSPGCYRRSPA